MSQASHTTESGSFTRERYHELDSLRGLAALSVVFWHFLLIVPSIYNNEPSVKLIRRTPLSIFWSGPEAVLFFFVLSGFVLSLPFSNKPGNYIGYMIKRVCRIWIPYICSVFVALLLAKWLYNGVAPSLSDWFNSTWFPPLNSKLILGHVFLIDSFENGRLNPVYWSLVHEMRISLIYPVIYFVCTRVGWRTLLIAMYLSTWIVGSVHDSKSDVIQTLHYIPFFMMGTMLALNRVSIVRWVSGLNTDVRTVLLISAVALYTCGSVNYYPVLKELNKVIYQDWLIAAGISLFIVLAIGWKSMQNILRYRPIVGLGVISYSLYLYHALALLALLRGGYGNAKLWVLYSAAFGLSIACAAVSYWVIERPSIRLGRYLAGKMPARRVLVSSGEQPRYLRKGQTNL